MNSKFLNKKILIPLLCGIGCFTLTFLLTKAINHDEGKSLEITSRNKKLLSNLEEIDLEMEFQMHLWDQHQILEIINTETQTDLLIEIYIMQTSLFLMLEQII